MSDEKDDMWTAGFDAGYEDASSRLESIIDAWSSADIRTVEARFNVRAVWHGLADLLDALTEEKT